MVIDIDITIIIGKDMKSLYQHFYDIEDNMYKNGIEDIIHAVFVKDDHAKLNLSNECMNTDYISIHSIFAYATN